MSAPALAIRSSVNKSGASVVGVGFVVAIDDDDVDVDVVDDDDDDDEDFIVVGDEVSWCAVVLGKFFSFLLFMPSSFKNVCQNDDDDASLFSGSIWSL
jgi:hypothetical protein